MLVRNLFLVLFLVSIQECLSQKRCDMKLLKKMSDKFHNCTHYYKKIYQNNILTKGANIEVITCELVDNVVNDCSEIWRECHSVEEVKQIKIMQVEALVEKNRNVFDMIQFCSSIQTYRSLFYS